MTSNSTVKLATVTRHLGAQISELEVKRMFEDIDDRRDGYVNCDSCEQFVWGRGRPKPPVVERAMRRIKACL